MYFMHVWSVISPLRWHFFFNSLHFLCRNTVDTHGALILNLRDQLVHGAHRPFKHVQTHNWLSSQAMPTPPPPLSPSPPNPRSPQDDQDWGAFALSRQRSLKTAVEGGGGLRVSWQHTPEPPAGEPRHEPVCPAAFTVVWLTLGLLVVVVVVAGGTDPRGQRWVGSHVLMNVFLSLDIGHLTISSQKLNYTDFFFFSCPTLFLQESHRSTVAANSLCHVQNRGRSPNRFCLFRCHVQGPVQPLVRRTYGNRCVSVTRKCRMKTRLIIWTWKTLQRMVSEWEAGL